MARLRRLQPSRRRFPFSPGTWSSPHDSLHSSLHVLRIQEDLPDISEQLASLTLARVDEVCAANVEELPSELLTSGREFHIRWLKKHNDEQDNDRVLLDFDGNDDCIHAFILLMRNPGPYDGGMEPIFSKYVNIAISQLFDSRDVCLVG